MPQHTNRSLPALATWCSIALPFATLGATEALTVEWSDTSRDVYVDGELEPGTVVLTAEAAGEAGERLAVLSARANGAFVVDLDALEVVELPLASFELTATGATSTAAPGAAEALTAGRATRVRDQGSTHYLATAGGHTLLISPHQGPAGKIELEELFQVAPTWRRRAESYTPDEQAVAALAAYDEPVDVNVSFGTWCGDSRNYVPKLIRSLEVAANPNLHLELVAIGRGFGEPAEHILGRRLTNVPTVIVSQGGEEIGRIVETPATQTVEADLAAILRRAPVPHQGRLSREAEIAHGRYVYRDAEDRELGDETWQLYATEGGGRLLHCAIVRDSAAPEGRPATLDVWHRRDEAGASNLVELTRSRGDELSRTRIWIEDGQLHALTRGNVTGIVEQRLALPPGTNFALPCAADAGTDWLRRGRPGEATITAFQLAADTPAAGKLVGIVTRSAGEEALTTGHGKTTAVRFTAQSGGVASSWWLDGELGVPVRGTVDGLGRVTLEELTVAESAETVAAAR
jgi:CBS domain-containing protein